MLQQNKVLFPRLEAMLPARRTEIEIELLSLSVELY